MPIHFENNAASCVDIIKQRTLTCMDVIEELERIRYPIERSYTNIDETQPLHSIDVRTIYHIFDYLMPEGVRVGFSNMYNVYEDELDHEYFHGMYLDLDSCTYSNNHSRNHRPSLWIRLPCKPENRMNIYMYIQFDVTETHLEFYLTMKSFVQEYVFE